MSVFFYGCVTLDGYLADKTHGLDWLHQTGNAEDTGYDAFYQKMDVTIMGKRTYDEIVRLEDASSVYPTTENYVFTHSANLSRKGFTSASGDVSEFVSGLGPDKNIWIVAEIPSWPAVECGHGGLFNCSACPCPFGGGNPAVYAEERSKTVPPGPSETVWAVRGS